MLFFFFKQKTAYEMRISDWSSDVCSSDLVKKGCYPGQEIVARTHFLGQAKRGLALFECDAPLEAGQQVMDGDRALGAIASAAASGGQHLRSEEHTSELQSLMRTSYAVFCLKKKKIYTNHRLYLHRTYSHMYRC